MPNVYNIRNSGNTIVATISETQRNTTATSLVLHGRGAKNYGFERDQNALFLLENFSGSPQPLNPIDGQLWWKPGDQMYVYDTGGSPVTFVTIVPTPEALGFNVIAGDGLTGGGAPTGSPLLTTLNLGQGTGTTVTANAVSTNDAQIVHSALSNYVNVEHIDHSTINIVAGLGLTGGGTLTSSRTLNIGLGTGITTVGNALSVDSTAVRTFGNQFISGYKLFIQPILSGRLGSPVNPAKPSYAFEGAGATTGMYRSAANELSFSTGGTQRFKIEPIGVLRSLNATYETIVTHDDDIPNKKYVDDLAAAGGGSSSPTSNTVVGVTSVTGLTIGKKYLITTFGTTRNNGTGTGTIGGVRLTQGTTPGSGTQVAFSPMIPSINWPDGNIGQCVTHIVVAPSTSIAGTIDYRYGGSVPIEYRSPTYMMAVQLD